MSRGAATASGVTTAGGTTAGAEIASGATVTGAVVVVTGATTVVVEVELDDAAVAVGSSLELHAATGAMSASPAAAATMERTTLPR